MAQSKILLDTASYLRLAKSIHPLLFVPFGADNHCLYVLKELDDEVLRSRRLKTKFPWVSEDPYCQNRKTRLTLSKADSATVAQAEEFLWDHVVNELPGPSRIDCKALAHGFVLTIPVVTDDQDMRALATAFDIQTLSTLRLVALMLTCNHVTIETIRSMMRFWLHELDLPAGCREDYAALFGEPFPS